MFDIVSVVLLAADHEYISFIASLVALHISGQNNIPFLRLYKYEP